MPEASSIKLQCTLVTSGLTGFLLITGVLFGFCAGAFLGGEFLDVSGNSLSAETLRELLKVCEV